MNDTQKPIYPLIILLLTAPKYRISHCDAKREKAAKIKKKSKNKRDDKNEELLKTS